MKFKPLITYAFVASLGCGPAFAGGLDGQWCSPEGERITVEALDVITPGGHHTTGAYSNGNFLFELPAPERNAGAVIWMEPKSAGTARVSVVSENQNGPPPHDLWRKCDVTS